MCLWLCACVGCRWLLLEYGYQNSVFYHLNGLVLVAVFFAVLCYWYSLACARVVSLLAISSSWYMMCVCVCLCVCVCVCVCLCVCVCVYVCVCIHLILVLRDIYPCLPACLPLSLNLSCKPLPDPSSLPLSAHALPPLSFWHSLTLLGRCVGRG